MRRVKILVGITLVLVLISNCGNQKDNDILSREELVNLLIDLHLYDAMATDYSLNTHLEDIDSASLYTSVLSKHEIDRDGFYKTLQWYSNHPDEFASIYDEVFGTLNKQYEGFNKLGSLFSGNGAREIWSNKRYKHIHGDTVKYPDPYIVEIVTTGTYLFDIKCRMLTQDLSEDPYLNVYFFKHESDQVPSERLEVCRVPIIKSNFTRDYQYQFLLEDPSYRFIKIILPETPDRLAGKQKNLQINRVRVLRKNEAGDPEPKEDKEKE